MLDNRRTDVIYMAEKYILVFSTKFGWNLGLFQLHSTLRDPSQVKRQLGAEADK
jgi:hypothetical protein